MNIFINGENTDLSAINQATVTDALAAFLSEHQTQLSYAVAVNGTFVSKDNYSTTKLKANDTLDVLFPIVGG